MFVINHLCKINNRIQQQQQQQHWTPASVQQYEPGPVQSRSFRVLQKITDTDSASNDMGTEQIRKLELSEDEKILMNKFKEQGKTIINHFGLS